MSNTPPKKIDYVTLPKEKPTVYFSGKEPELFTRLEKDEITKGLKLEISEQKSKKTAFYSKVIKFSLIFVIFALTLFVFAIFYDNEFLTFFSLWITIFSLLTHIHFRNLIEKL